MRGLSFLLLCCAIFLPSFAEVAESDADQTTILKNGRRWHMVEMQIDVEASGLPQKVPFCAYIDGDTIIAEKLCKRISIVPECEQEPTCASVYYAYENAGRLFLVDVITEVASFIHLMDFNYTSNDDVHIYDLANDLYVSFSGLRIGEKSVVNIEGAEKSVLPVCSLVNGSYRIQNYWIEGIGATDELMISNFDKIGRHLYWYLQTCEDDGVVTFNRDNFELLKENSAIYDIKTTVIPEYFYDVLGRKLPSRPTCQPYIHKGKLFWH